eukprot:1317040-Rhodomonas_salina.2
MLFLCRPYVKSGTGIRVSSCALPMPSPVLICCYGIGYALSGTESGYASTRRPVLRWGMLLRGGGRTDGSTPRSKLQVLGYSALAHTSTTSSLTGSQISYWPTHLVLVYAFLISTSIPSPTTRHVVPGSSSISYSSTHLVQVCPSPLSY